jgi:RHS repeat-associated protein
VGPEQTKQAVTDRTVPGGFDVVGLANNAASVTVNSSPSDYRRGEYFQEAVSVSNGSVPVWQQIGVTATNSGSSSNWPAGYVFIPKTAENFAYDQDGNLTSDGRWTNKWDGENRLVEMLSLTNSPANSKFWLKFTYDAQGRRIAKQASLWTNSAWSVVVSNRFLYDGWNLVAELNATNNAVIRRYQWGLDLSGSEQGAGGVGGLLSISYLPAPTSSFVAYDGNGNVAGLVDVMTGSVTANYEYGPFAEPIRMSGAMAKANPFRFSTKYQDDETDLLYYGYRYYSPGLGRFIGRDPAGELAGPNEFLFVRNSSPNRFDVSGLYDDDVHLYVVYYILRAKGFTDGESVSVARASQFVDRGQRNPTDLGRRWSSGTKGQRGFSVGGTSQVQPQ